MIKRGLSKRLSGLLILLLSGAILFGCNKSPNNADLSGTTTTPTNNTSPGDGSSPGNSTTPTPTPSPGPTLSSDATISNISVTPASLDQVVQSSQTSYTATVGYFLSSVKVTVTLSDSNATLNIGGINVASGQTYTVPLAVGANAISAHVVAEDGTTSQTYTIDVTRLSLAEVAQQAYAKASNAEMNDNFGESVSISGNTMVVGADGEDGDASSTASTPNNNASSAGAAYVFVRNNGVWTQQAYLKASNAESGDEFGYSVSISGDTIVVGAYAEAGDATSTASNPNNNASGAGAAYVFVRSNGVWTQQAYLKASNAEANDDFGWSVSISGDSVVVGANYEAGDAASTASSPNNNAGGAGAAYVFARSNGIWTQQAYLKASNAESGDDFGHSVAINGDSVVIGADSEAGDATSSLSSPNNNASDAGAAYVFSRSNGVWTQQAYLKASNAEAGDLFGNSVAISGDSAVVGANYEAGDNTSTASNPNNNNPYAGAAYVFVRSNGVWSQQAYLKASNAESDDDFGWSVAISGDTIAVGADYEAGDASSTVSNSNNNAYNAGAAYVFTRSNGVWTQQAYLKASNVEEDDSFGNSIATDGDTVAIGAYYEAGDANSTASNPNNSAYGAGAAYLYR